MQRIFLMLQERWLDILIGFTIPIILGAVKLVVEKLRLVFDKRNEGFAIEGIWCSIHNNYLGQCLVEFLKIKYSRTNHMDISIKQIRDNDRICRYIGIGIKSNNLKLRT